MEPWIGSPALLSRVAEEEARLSGCKGTESVVLEVLVEVEVSSCQAADDLS